MGIYDREYVRMGPRSKSGMGSLRFISFNSWLIILNVAVFLIDGMLGAAARPVIVAQDVRAGVSGRNIEHRAIAQPPFPAGSYVQTIVVDKTTGEQVGRGAVAVMTPAQNFGHMSTARGFFGMQVWRFVTFQFLHANIWHLVMNMFGLWIFGGMVEQFLGFKRYAAFYLTCGVFGAISYLLLNLLGEGVGLRLPGVLLENPFTPLVGASAGVFGVIMACAYIAPEAIVQLIFPPIPLKLKFFAYGYVALAAFNLLRGGANAGGDAAHIGGAIAGFFFIRNSHLLRDFFDIFGDSRRGGAAFAPPQSDEEEVDRILKKVSVQGLGSLNEKEKAALRKAGQRGRG